ncbi:MAG: acyltransferase [Muribaculaceae bacterium]|nr:acyltransferase [Muribaculaceae bacterium]
MVSTKLYMVCTAIFNLFKLKIQQYKYNNCELSNRIKLCGRVRFKLGRKAFMKLSEGCVVTGGAFINCLGCLRGSCIQVENGATLQIGRNSGMSNVSIWVRDKVIIGDYVTIGAETIINDSNSHCINYLERRGERKNGVVFQELNIKRAPIYIENDVFIGARSIICKGVRIGTRSVIAAGSVVVKDIPSDEVWGGNPCKFLRKLENNV